MTEVVGMVCRRQQTWCDLPHSCKNEGLYNSILLW